MDPAQFWIRFALASLGLWRLSHALVHESGPFDLIDRLRARLAGTQAARTLECVGCTSLWLALPAAAAATPDAHLVLPVWLALSGAAFLLERLTDSPLLITPGSGETHDLLHQPPNPAAGGAAGHTPGRIGALPGDGGPGDDAALSA